MRVAGSETKRSAPKPGTYLFIPAGRAAQHRQRERQAGKDDHDRIANPVTNIIFEELVKLVARSNPPDAKAIAELRSRYDTEPAISAKGQLAGSIGRPEPSYGQVDFRVGYAPKAECKT